VAYENKHVFIFSHINSAGRRPETRGRLQREGAHQVSIYAGNIRPKSRPGSKKRLNRGEIHLFPRSFT